jgi:arylsulfatase A-like enzyme
MFSNAIDPMSQNFHPETIITPPELKKLEDLRQIFDGYDLGIRRADEHTGIIFDALKGKGVFDDLIIIISSDHGENMGELGIYAEHGTADQVTTRIPLIIRWPGMQSGVMDEGLHYNLDLMPTLADLLGIEPFSTWDGRSFASTVREGFTSGRDYLVLSQSAHVCQRAVRFDNWIYMRTYHDGYHLFPTEMLFDLENDPHEQFNLASKYPEICKQAVYYLNEWHSEMMQTSDSPIDPMQTVIHEGGPYHARGQLREYCKLLEETGRGWAIEELKKRHPSEFK